MILPIIFIVLLSIRSSSPTMSFAVNPNNPPYGCQNNGACSSLSQHEPYMECAPGACLCREGYTGERCETNMHVDYCASNPCNDREDCRSVAAGWYMCWCSDGYNGPECYPEASDPCAAYGADYCLGFGCTNTAGSSHGMVCNCPAGKTGKNCSVWIECSADTDCLYNTACNAEQGWCECFVEVYHPGYENFDDRCGGYQQCPYTIGTEWECKNGTCTHEVDLPTTSFFCDCFNCYTGEYCETLIDYCTSGPCQNGGTCTPIECDVKCVCPPAYSGTFCEDFVGACSGTPCLNGGTCTETNGGVNFTCRCTAGYTDETCATEIGVTTTTVDATSTTASDSTTAPAATTTTADFCASSPCMNGGTCILTSTSFACKCLPGYDGPTCDLEDPCNAVRTPDGVLHPSPCQIFDTGASCISHGESKFTCVCSPNFTDTACNLTLDSFTVLERMFSPLPWEQIRNVLAEIVRDPTSLNTAFLYELARMNNSARTDLSWTLDELFEFIAYERRELEAASVLVMFNDITLGNCFTFNHRNGSETYAARRAGDSSGLQVGLKLQRQENLPYIISASYNVFIHNASEDVFYDSLRQQPQPAAETRLAFSRTSHEYMTSGPKCISDASEITPYYFDRTHYLQQACYRSCYQHAVVAACGCADYSYPKPDDCEYCNISRRDCVEDYKATSDMPSTWHGCGHCKMPCGIDHFEITASASDFLSIMPVECEGAANVSKCVGMLNDRLEVTVSFSTLRIHAYVEEYAMSLSSLMSFLGGTSGVCIGVGVPFVFELLFLLFILLVTPRQIEDE